MMRNLYVLAVVMLASQAVPLLAASERPRVGLALSGGGTKAGAHIGVLRVLEANHIPIDYIAGTSAGAIIGGLYAAGLSPDDIEAAIADIDWEDMLDDRPPRRDLPYRRKSDDYSYLVKYRPGFNDGRIDLPLGLVDGNQVVQFFRRHLGPGSGHVDFDELRVPFRVVTTDLVTGEAVVLERGDLALAVRASMSVPVFFAPVEIDGRRLIDGGPANNLPIDVVRDMGADLVIAVDITTGLRDDADVNSVVAVADQLTNFLIQRSVREQIASLGERDVLIRPALDDISGFEFDRTLDSVAPGEAATRAALPQLTVLATVAPETRDFVNRRAAVTGETLRFVRIDNRSGLSDTIIRSRLGLAVGDPVDLADIERAVARVQGLDLFDRVDYRIERSAGGAGLVVAVRSKPWGPRYLQFGVELVEDFSQGSEFNLGVAYLATEVNSLGGEWRAQVDLGERQGLSFDWYQPVSRSRRYFVEAELAALRRSFRFFDGDTAVADLRVNGWGGRLSFGTELGSYGELRAGWNRFSGDGDTVVGAVPGLSDDVDIGEWFASVQIDRLDDINFPHDGISAYAAGFWSREDAGARGDFEQIAAGMTFAASRGDSTLLVGIEGATTPDDDAPLESQYLLGGLGRLSGFANNRFAGQHYGLATLTAYHRLRRSFWFPVYAGISVEAGNVWNDSSTFGTGEWLTSSALYAGADTPLGPLYAALGYAEGGESTVYLFLGNPFVRLGARPFD